MDLAHWQLRWQRELASLKGAMRGAAHLLNDSTCIAPSHQEPFTTWPVACKHLQHTPLAHTSLPHAPQLMASSSPVQLHSEAATASTDRLDCMCARTSSSFTVNCICPYKQAAKFKLKGTRTSMHSWCGGPVHLIDIVVIAEPGCVDGQRLPVDPNAVALGIRVGVQPGNSMRNE